jgi:hypothetical protein
MHLWAVLIAAGCNTRVSTAQMARADATDAALPDASNSPQHP